uniref:Uncharacterized protein n=3 Tax=Parascaris TaxID=6254 RepID=A0A915BUZ4_PARUN
MATVRSGAVYVYSSEPFNCVRQFSLVGVLLVASNYQWCSSSCGYCAPILVLLLTKMLQGRAMLVALAGALFIAYAYAAAAVMPVKVGGDAVIKFGAEVNEILQVVGGPEDRQPIVKDGKLTELGRNKFGERATFADGTLTIHKLQESDLTDFFYQIANKPMVITLQSKE